MRSLPDDLRALIREELRVVLREELAAIKEGAQGALPPPSAPLDADQVREILRTEVLAAMNPERLRIVFHSAQEHSPVIPSTPAASPGWWSRLVAWLRS
ncbi:hypothetical protein [Deinococcus peraridilitoris]|uniref:Uncharacterized protein n=1 Tax=Deinococcus peraridilitoris (strain DSM 19664 / LMG 22246 / CIP 109416 / KR-200) TaxID=937777 RepID=K9ZZA4_DEIPD|nr:hypothetical protein [Deinococcus peraridilitoris]AFZ66926.1 hypothetical protein Deipe_1381 [Deinococcus peraridilitoris DSM 19664]